MKSPGDLSASECWDLLSRQSIGRLALSVQALPAILPVQYYVEGDSLAICLGHFRAADRSIDNSVAAFGVDAIDLGSWSGLSVQVLGTLSRQPVPGAASDCGQPGAGQVVWLTPATVDGHRLNLCPFLST